MKKIKIKLLKSDEVYFKVTTQYELEVDGMPLKVRTSEDSNGAEYFVYSESKKAWTNELTEYMYNLVQEFNMMRDEIEIGEELEIEEEVGA